MSGVLHGGVTATLVDVAVGLALAHRGYKATTVELKINYLRPVTGRKVTARSHLLRIGKTLVHRARGRIRRRQQSGGRGASHLHAAGIA